MATRKSWSEHSARWKREAVREGLSARRWDLWRKLSPKARADSDPRAYAQGKSVPQQRLERKQSTAIDKIMSVKAGVARRFTVARGVVMMDSDELHKINSMSPVKLDSYMTRMARRKMQPGQHNPYWYR